jgi:hypothetical protein
MPVLTVSVLLTCGRQTLAAGDVILWNRLGSLQEVERSEIGPCGAFAAGSYAFESAQFANGFVRTGREFNEQFASLPFLSPKRPGQTSNETNDTVPPVPDPMGCQHLGMRDGSPGDRR